MIIVLEGPDNSGKSTLASFISSELGLPIRSSEGPEKYPGEIDERVRRYDLMDDIIFDRHPCVSQEIYRQFNPSQSPVDRGLLGEFYRKGAIFVYCADRGLDGHVTKAEYDTEEHLRRIQANHNKIVVEYEKWASKYALVWYHVGLSMQTILQVIKGIRDGVSNGASAR